MGLLFYPTPGTLLMCDFNTGFKPPEMVKTRPVVVVGKKQSQLAVVVPLSTTEPVPFEPYHVEMELGSLPRSLRGARCWAKCNMVSCVALWRLDRIKDGKDPKTGKRIYVAPEILPGDLVEIRKALRHVLLL
jgi:mRNA interferase MazF